MSLGHGASVVRNGLVLQYDMANTQKSWRGAPTTNLHPIGGYLTWPTQTLHFWDGNSWVVNSTYTNPGVPGPAGTYLGEVRKYTSGALSASWSGNSHAYVLKTAPMTAGQSYAMSAYTYLSTDCNIDGMNSSIEGASVSALSGGYVTTYNMSQKGSWQRQGLQGSGSGNVNFIVAYPYKLGVTNGVFTGSILVGGAQVEFGTFPTPYTDTSRSNTQAIVDLTGNNTVTATSLTYANDGTFSFNGTSNKLTTATLPYQFLNTGFTASLILKYTQTTTNDNVISWGGSAFNITSYAWELRIRGSGNVEFSPGIGPGGSGVPARTSYTPSVALNGRVAFLDITYVANGLASIYENGILRATNNYSGVGISNATNSLIIGQGTDTYFPGTMHQVKLYSRALSAQEVQQNFEATRGRYGI